MANKARGKDHPEFYRSMLAAIQWRAGRFPAAAATLDKLGDRLDPDAFTRVQVWAPAAVSEVRAMTSPHAPALAQARAAEQSGDADAALAAYARAAAKIGADHPGSLFVNSRINALKLQRQFATGQWVNLTPADPASPWAPVGGHWDREKDGTVVARSDARGRAAFLCLADFGPAFEFRARLHRTDPKLDSIPVLLVQWRTDEAFHCGGIVTGTSSAYARGSDRIVNHKFKYKGGELVTVRVQNEAMTVLVDDKPVIENLVANDPPPGARNCVGLGIYGQEPNLTAKFTDVQIRRLDSDKKED
jgi:hypothetical protein